MWTIKAVTPVIQLQLDSEKYTGRYFKLRDDDLSSKQGSFKMYIQNDKIKNYLIIFSSIYICYKIKT